MSTLHMCRNAPQDGRYPIRLTLKQAGKRDREAETNIRCNLAEQEHDDLGWYLEDYLLHAETVQAVTSQQVEALMKTRGEEFTDLRIEITTTTVADAASIPWELTRDPKMDPSIPIRTRSFVRVQSNSAICFVSVLPAGSRTQGSRLTADELQGNERSELTVSSAQIGGRPGYPV